MQDAGQGDEVGIAGCRCDEIEPMIALACRLAVGFVGVICYLQYTRLAAVAVGLGLGLGRGLGLDADAESPPGVGRDVKGCSTPVLRGESEDVAGTHGGRPDKAATRLDRRLGGLCAWHLHAYCTADSQPQLGPRSEPTQPCRLGWPGRFLAPWTLARLYCLSRACRYSTETSLQLANPQEGKRCISSVSAGRAISICRASRGGRSREGLGIAVVCRCPHSHSPTTTRTTTQQTSDACQYTCMPLCHNCLIPMRSNAPPCPPCPRRQTGCP